MGALPGFETHRRVEKDNNEVMTKQFTLEAY